jgi:hypothetical protein
MGLELLDDLNGQRDLVACAAQAPPCARPRLRDQWRHAVPRDGLRAEKDVARGAPARKCLSASPVIASVKQAAAALQHAHYAKLIHRDVKSDIMLLDSGDQVLLSNLASRGPLTTPLRCRHWIELALPTTWLLNIGRESRAQRAINMLWGS